MTYVINPPNFRPVLDVSACFVEYAGKFILLHRAMNTSQGNTWCLPGGKVRKGEDATVAAVRETQEETGLHITPQQITLLYTAKTRSEYDFTYHVYRTRLHESLNVQINKKDHSEWRLVTVQEALQLPLTPPLRDVIERTIGKHR